MLVLCVFPSELNRRSQDQPASFTLTDEFGGNVNTVTIACKYIPVDIKIEPRESVNSVSQPASCASSR